MRRFLLGTAAFHAVLAVLIFVHARRRGRSAGRWGVLTLAFGLGGVAGYALLGR
ncbi:hypothetical protein [Halalkalicoccus sp. NIPERK01]|uniref:hypothetical protein n=1 Tax=Halalkalicoccus sp. NIPERK01 TaxID=3053469 RepID=UPI00256F3DF2|nr:hypothetical protein [Halalkalicoccus sp. NIPERK01]MDL5362365.1 hypothetical protein [Halalkalicoccus sp. NIPERK01]